jgi:hypothetical protein
VSPGVDDIHASNGIGTPPSHWTRRVDCSQAKGAILVSVRPAQWRPAPKRTAAPRSRRRTPDGLSVLVVADFSVRMAVWGLVDHRCTYLPGPKHAAKGLAFDPTGSSMAVLEVRAWARLNLPNDWPPIEPSQSQAAQPRMLQVCEVHSCLSS